MTRGLAEMTRLGIAIGAQPETFGFGWTRRLNGYLYESAQSQ